MEEHPRQANLEHETAKEEGNKEEYWVGQFQNRVEWDGSVEEQELSKVKEWGRDFCMLIAHGCSQIAALNRHK